MREGATATRGLRAAVKRQVFYLLGKDPEAVVVTFLTGPPELAARMFDEIVRLEPARRHFAVAVDGQPAPPGKEVVRLKPGGAGELYAQLRRAFSRYRIGLAPVLFTGEVEHAPLRRAALLLAPRKVLAYNGRLERHHLKLSAPVASLLFLKGVPLDRIRLRPRWLCPWRKDRTSIPPRHHVIEGRAPGESRPRVAVLSPFFPYPLSHGGAVRLYYLLREMAREYDVYLFAFLEDEQGRQLPDVHPLEEFCAKLVLAYKPRYREPRWSTLDPPEVCEYRSPVMRGLLDRFRQEWDIPLTQVEYTALASYPGDILVEHDVTFDLYQQVAARRRTLGAWWDAWRWRRYERKAIARYARVVAMSAKDAEMLGAPHVAVIPNGCDLERFRAVPERPGQRLLFIGSFRHFPNVHAYQFFAQEVWPRLKDRFPEMTVTVVAGLDPLFYWREAAGSAEPPRDGRIKLLEFVADVRPLYEEANIVLVPTLESAGTNVKVLEAMAMRRAVVSTPSGCGGLGLEHGEQVWISETAEQFADGTARLAEDPELRRRLADNAYRLAAERYSWPTLGELQRGLLRGMLTAEVATRRGGEADLEAVRRIQEQSLPGSNWAPRQYLGYVFRVAESKGKVVGFLVSRETAPDEREVLNLAVAPGYRRLGVATRLMEEELARVGGAVFLEVRESNRAAQSLYRKLGFHEAGKRPNYYDHPPEAAIVMRIEA